ncbi:MAG: hypothetical protein ACE5HK_05085 [Candidatus Methylomirabilales bacterium]
MRPFPAIFLFLLAAGLAPPQVDAIEFQPEGFPLPDLRNYTLVREFVLAFDDERDPQLKHPVLVRRLAGPGGQVVLAYLFRSRVFAYAIVPPGAPPERHYALRDSRCHGIFDEKYRPDEEVYVPRCLLDGATDPQRI